MKVNRFMHEMQTTSSILGRNAGIDVVFEGKQAKTDGKTIYLPSMPQEHELTKEQVLTMRGYVDHEAGHIRHSDMDRIMEFYDRCQNNDKEKLQFLHNAVEDVWMEDQVMQEYPGSWKNLYQCQELVRGREVSELARADPSVSVPFHESMSKKTPDAAAMAIVTNKPAFKDGLNNQAARALVTEEDVLKWSDRWAELALQCKNSNDTIDLAKSIWELLEDPEKMSSMDPQDFDGTEGAGMEEGENSEAYKNSGGKKAETAEGTKVKGRDGEWGDYKGEGEGDDKIEFQPGRDRLESDLADGDSAGGGIGDLGTMSGSTHYKVYSTSDDKYYLPGKGKVKDGSRDYNDIITATDTRGYYASKNKMRASILVMKSKLRRALMAKLQRDWEFGREVGRLDTKRLVAASQGINTVFKKRVDREDEDTAVSILIDMSGSMHGRKVEYAQDCAIALAECFEGTQIKYRISGFSNREFPNGAADSYYDNRGRSYHRYERLDHIVFKNYNDTLRQRRAQLGHVEQAAGGNNSDYDFIVRELNTLRDRPEARKVLFVLSDGSPACSSDYSYDDHTKHCKKAIDAARRQGVECVGIGICDSAVKNIYDDHVVINNPSDLSKVAFNKLTKILLGNKR